MGWLEVGPCNGAHIILRCFNSTMGWLEENAWDEPPHHLVGFQFHYGMIGSGRCTRFRPAPRRFQFHYGMIGRNIPGYWQLEDKLSFNSTMGWLEVDKIIKSITIYPVSIPLWDDWKSNCSLLYTYCFGCFNSTMGWLEAVNSAERSLFNPSFNSTMGWLEVAYATRA